MMWLESLSFFLMDLKVPFYIMNAARCSLFVCWVVFLFYLRPFFVTG
jgi:hypothetical protein